MRFIPVNCIREGMICGKKLIGKKGELLLNAGAEIYASYVDSIKELGYNGIYIEDDLSADIEILDVINSDLRMKSVSTIKNVFISIENGGNIPDKNEETIHRMVGEIVESIMSDKQLMVNLIDLKVFDDYTFYHSVNVGVLSVVVGTALGLGREQLHNLGMAGLLHDIGKVFIPREILNKPGKLTDEEYEIIKSHSFKGYEYLKERFGVPASCYVGVLQHHEKFDGTGYPNAADGSKISLFGRIIAVADVYDALTSDRPYRRSLIPSEAAELIMGGGDSLFDPSIVTMFIQKIAPYPVGTPVLLSDNRMGIVVKNYSDCCLRPNIKIVKHGIHDVEPYYLDLRAGRSTLDITVIGISEIV